MVPIAGTAFGRSSPTTSSCGRPRLSAALRLIQTIRKPAGFSEASRSISRRRPASGIWSKRRRYWCPVDAAGVCAGAMATPSIAATARTRACSCGTNGSSLPSGLFRHSTTRYAGERSPASIPATILPGSGTAVPGSIRTETSSGWRKPPGRRAAVSRKTTSASAQPSIARATAERVQSSFVCQQGSSRPVTSRSTPAQSTILPAPSLTGMPLLAMVR